MKNTIYKLFFGILLFILLIFSVSAQDYEIKNYKMDLKVNIDNTININEEIDVYFNVGKHGIYRKIPLINDVKRLDGSSSIVRARVRDISVNEQYTEYVEQNYKVIKIGNPYEIVYDEKKYVINYLYDLGKDKSKKYDELYFNIIGNEWDTSIKHVEFIIEMPKEFDASKIGFSSGLKGSINNENVNYTVEGNTISGSLNETLSPGEALTIRIELPEGYFVVPSKKISKIQFIYIMLPIIFAGISYLLWKKFGDDDEVIDTVEFYPPKGFNSLEIGYIYNGESLSQHTTSLIVYLANKGYLKIVEIPKDENKLFSTDSYKFVKLKEYDGDNENERLFLEGLFIKKGSLFVPDLSVDEIEPKDLKNKFYIVMKKIQKNLKGKSFGKKYFTKGENLITFILGVFIFSVLAMINIPPMIEYGIHYAIAIFTVFVYLIGIYLISAMIDSIIKDKSSSVIILILMPGILVLFVSWILLIKPFINLVYPALAMEKVYLITYVIGMLCIIVMMICSLYMKKRTKEGHAVYEKIIGFRKFLEAVEVPRLEALVHQNPNYFYDILPFAYVLDLSSEWINKFESIVSEPPSWYSGRSFSFSSFNSFMDSTLASTDSALSSSPSGSGGGCAGGGSGGGGGGSW